MRHTKASNGDRPHAARPEGKTAPKIRNTSSNTIKATGDGATALRANTIQGRAERLQGLRKGGRKQQGNRKYLYNGKGKRVGQV